MARKAAKPQRRGVFPFAISLYAVDRREISERPFYSFAPLRLCEKKKYMARKAAKPQRRGVFPFAISMYAIVRREISERPFYSFASLRLCEKKKPNYFPW
jgi:hypothetical protein